MPKGKKTDTREPFRWTANITYRSDHGEIVVFKKLREIADLHEAVESGPHWDTVVGIVVARVNHNTSPTLTIEQADKL